MGSNPDSIFRFQIKKTEKLQHFSDTQHLKKSENPVFPKIFGPVDQPSLVGYIGPIQSNQDKKRPRKWRN